MFLLLVTVNVNVNVNLEYFMAITFLKTYDMIFLFLDRGKKND